MFRIFPQPHIHRGPQTAANVLVEAINLVYHQLKGPGGPMRPKQAVYQKVGIFWQWRVGIPTFGRAASVDPIV
jgi:hypothetical protein